MANIFNSVKIKLKRKNKFNLSYTSRLTTEFGRLTPIMCEEVLPNDTFRISPVLRCQFAPMKFPVMQKFTAYVHFFFVPRRLLMTGWEEFITGGEDGLSPIKTPTVALTDHLLYDEPVSDPEFLSYFKSSSLFDYLGFPSIDTTHLEDIFAPNDPVVAHDIDLMPFKAYQLVYNEWYRDQNLSDEVEIYKDDSGIVNLLHGNNTFNEVVKPLFTLRNRAWRKDYFTSALPDPQRGPDVTLPLIGGDIPITSDGDLDVISDIIQEKGRQAGYETPTEMQMHSSSGTRTFLGTKDFQFPDNTNVEVKGSLSQDEVEKMRVNIGTDGLRSATINEVRRAFAVQRWYELAARAGNRYIESILAHFGIRSSDARLQRPEYIGGSVVPVNVGDILQTSETGETPLGTPAGIAQALGRVKRIKYTSEEHGYILGILSIIPEASYPQGMPRKYMRRDKFDFAWPLLANIGEQQIARGELYMDYGETPASNRQGFGYAPRYSEYKFGVGQVHGDFRTSLRDFHDARFFNRRPLLNQEFIEVSTNNDGDDGLNRIFAVRSSTMADHLWVNIYNDVVVRRVLPKYGTPV